MPRPESITVPQYITIVALIYILAFVAIVMRAGEFHLSELQHWQFWILPLVAVGIALFVTLGSIWRFGAAGGSIYAIPTLTHILVLALMAIAALENGR